MIQYYHIDKKFVDFYALRNISMKIPTGTMCALLGPNGAGKTTWMRLLVGLLKPSSGKIEIAGSNLAQNRRNLLRRIGYVPQLPNLDKTLSGLHCAEFHSRLYQIGSLWHSRCEALAETLNLQEHLHKPVGSMSGGMRRKLMVLLALLHDPDLLILDEPTVGIDASNRREIWDLLLKLQQKGKTIIISTHSMEEASQLAQLVAILHQGSLLSLKPPQSILQATQTQSLEEAYLKLTFHRKNQQAVLQVSKEIS